VARDRCAQALRRSGDEPGAHVVLLMLVASYISM
jgi:hypothetical protein